VTSDALVQNIDIAPTVADLAGFPWGADGESLVPLLNGDAQTVRSAALVAWCQGAYKPCPENDPAVTGFWWESQNFPPSSWTVVRDRYKLISYITGEEELFDLDSDPYEVHNLADDPALDDVKAQLRSDVADLREDEVDTTIVSGPSGELGVRHVSYRYFSQSRLATYSCRLTHDGIPEPWKACDGGSITEGSLLDGDYLFEVAGTDEHGNVDPSPASRSFSIGSTGPPVSIDVHPPADTTERNVRFAVSGAPDIDGLECRLLRLGGSAAWQPCADGVEVDHGPLVDGLWNFQTRALAVGSWTSPPAEWLFRVDNDGPEIVFDQAPWHVTQRPVANFIFHPNEAVVGGLTCRLDSGASQDCSSARFDASNLESGPHVLEVSAVDVLGNEGTTSFEWAIDTTPPVASILSGPSGYTRTKEAKFLLGSSEPLGGFKCKVDDEPLWFCPDNVKYFALNEGPHTFTAHALDARRNLSGPITRTWTQDSIAPNTTITAGPTGKTKLRSATFRFVANESNATFQCKLDASIFKNCSSPTSYSGLTFRTHTFTVRAKDAAGNIGPGISRTWTVIR
jgi:hypothetical protein